MFLIKPEEWKKITPVWFDWLGWFLALGAIGYIAEKTKNIGLYIVYGISYIAFFMFITTTVSDIMKYKIIKHKKINTVITLIIAIGILALTTFTLHQGIQGLLKG